MLLTNQEHQFLAAFIREATTDPFKGPATEQLHRRDIYYNDLPHLLSAYYQEQEHDEGRLDGKQVGPLPQCPWKDRETAIRRDQHIEKQLDRPTPLKK